MWEHHGYPRPVNGLGLYQPEPNISDTAESAASMRIPAISKRTTNAHSASQNHQCFSQFPNNIIRWLIYYIGITIRRVLDCDVLVLAIRVVVRLMGKGEAWSYFDRYVVNAYRFFDSAL